MNVLEMYQCMQGEGLRTGEPSILVRFFGCNAMCVWCDTKYSINPKLHEEFHGPEIHHWTVDEVLKNLDLFPKYSVILTGGEPTIQHELPSLIYRLIVKDRFVTIETNGTKYIPRSLFDSLEGQLTDHILWSLSPKLPGAQTDAWDEIVMQDYLFHWTPGSVQFKFVVTSEEDFHQVETLLLAYPRFKLFPVILQPNGYTEHPYGEELQWLNDRVFNSQLQGFNMRVMCQLHFVTYGHKRLV